MPGDRLPDDRLPDAQMALVESPQAESPDLRGWFYRAVVPAATVRVLEVGDAYAKNWFTDVTRSDLATLGAFAGNRGRTRFGLVVLHDSLGGCPTLADALRIAVTLLEPGGTLALSGQNRLRRSVRGRRDRGNEDEAPTPCATVRGFASALRQCGLADIDIFAHDSLSAAPVHVVSIARRSAYPFYRAQLAAAPLSARRLAASALAWLNVLPYLQPRFLAVGRQC